jgi:hypothetical protein
MYVLVLDGEPLKGAATFERLNEYMADAKLSAEDQAAARIVPDVEWLE